MPYRVWVTEDLRQAALGIGKHLAAPLIYRNAESSFVGDDVAETAGGGVNNDTAYQAIFNYQQAR
jgi:hypothetical protein